jgi:hypothetical protein
MGALGLILVSMRALRLILVSMRALGKQVGLLSLTGDVELSALQVHYCFTLLLQRAPGTLLH